MISQKSAEYPEGFNNLRTRLPVWTSQQRPSLEDLLKVGNDMYMGMDNELVSEVYWA